MLRQSNWTPSQFFNWAFTDPIFLAALIANEQVQPDFLKAAIVGFSRAPKDHQIRDCLFDLLGHEDDRIRKMAEDALAVYRFDRIACDKLIEIKNRK